MASLSVIAVLSSLVVLSGAQCLEKYQCIFHHDIGGTEYSWDLHNLCRPTGQEYWVTAATSQQNFSFNVCGNATGTPCSWSGNVPQYDTTAVAIQWVGPTVSPDPLNPPCRNWDTGDEMTCTAMCEVVGTAYFQFTLLNPNDPNGGIIMQHDAMPPALTDPFQCPEDFNTGLLMERRWNLIITCDPSVNGLIMDYTVQGDLVQENPTCTYSAYTRSSAACGVKGDPYSYQTFGPGTNFGFTVLGAVILVALQVTYHVGENRGWWDPIKNRMPAIPGLGGGYKSYSKSTGGGFGSGSAFGGGAGTSSAASPITASAYGSA